MNLLNEVLLRLDVCGILYLFLLIVVSYGYLKWRRVSKLPPGPIGIPFLGYAPFIDKSQYFWRISFDHAKRYNSDITSMTLFGTTMVFLTSRDAAKEAFQKRHEMAERQRNSFIRSMNATHEGVISSSGQLWKDHRRFALLMLRDFGMGKIAAEQSIQDEAVILCQHFRDLGQDNACDPRTLVAAAVSNIVCAIGLGKRFSYFDPQFTAMLDAINFILSMMTSSYGHIVMSKISWLAPILYPEVKRASRQKYDLMCALFESIIKEHKNEFDGSVRDMIDGFLIEQSKHTDVNHTFTDEQLRNTIFDLLLAGTETTTTTLTWALLYLIKYPDLQERIYGEIASVIDKDRVANMSDRISTPYTEAFLLETQRINTVGPLAVPHSNSEDLQLMGYTIPANSAIFSNLAAIHRDPRDFADPDTFRPERFLDGDKVINAEKVNPFGIGRRACAGEALARMEVYIFFITMVQRLKFVSVNDQEVNVDCGLDCAVYLPKPFLLHAIPRQ